MTTPDPYEYLGIGGVPIIPELGLPRGSVYLRAVGYCLDGRQVGMQTIISRDLLDEPAAFLREYIIGNLTRFAVDAERPGDLDPPTVRASWSNLVDPTQELDLRVAERRES